MTTGRDAIRTHDTRFLSVSEVAERLGVSRRFLEREFASGALPTVRLGRRRLIRPADLERYVTDRLETSGASP